MASIKRFEDLEVWQLARELAKDIFELTKKTLFSKDFELKGQINKSAGSIMDNIAEGFERGGNKEFSQFLFIAKGSCGETRSQLYRAADRDYISKDEFSSVCRKAEKVSKQLSGLANYLKGSQQKGSKYVVGQS